MVRVIIERHCRPGREGELERLLVDMRSRAMRQRGYISGETLRGVDDPSLWLVIATWADADFWKVWETAAERGEIEHRIEPLLSAPDRVMVFRFAARGGAESAHIVDREARR